MSYDECKELHCKCWDEDFSYLYIVSSTEKNKGRYCIFNESKNSHMEFMPETYPLQILKPNIFCIHLQVDMI